MTRALGFRGHFTSNDMAFLVSHSSGDLDPDVNIFIRRAPLLRRIVARFPAVREKIAALIRAYGDIATPGTSGAIGLCNPRADECWGPIGLLLGIAAEAAPVGAPITKGWPRRRVAKPYPAAPVVSCRLS